MESEKLEPDQPKEEMPVFKTLDEWLNYYKLEKYLETFIKHGFDDINYIGEDIIDDKDMTTLKIDLKDQNTLKEALKTKGFIKGKFFNTCPLLITSTTNFFSIFRFFFI